MTSSVGGVEGLMKGQWAAILTIFLKDPQGFFGWRNTPQNKVDINQVWLSRWDGEGNTVYNGIIYTITTGWPDFAHQQCLFKNHAPNIQKQLAVCWLNLIMANLCEKRISTGSMHSKTKMNHWLNRNACQHILCTLYMYLYMGSIIP